MTPVRCETKAGLVFINMDDEAPPLAERLGLPDGYLEQYGMDRMHVVRHVVAEWGANWKNGVGCLLRDLPPACHSIPKPKA